MGKIIDLIIIFILMSIVIFLGYYAITNNLASITDLLLIMIISISFIFILFSPFFLTEEPDEEN